MLRYRYFKHWTFCQLFKPSQNHLNKELPVTNLESDSGEFIYQVEKLEDYDSDEEIKGDDIDESRIMSYSQGHPSDYELYWCLP